MQDEVLNITPQTFCKSGHLIEKSSQQSLTCESPTPLLRNKLKLGQYESIAESNSEIKDAEDPVETESESEHSLMEETDEADYYYKIRVLLDKVPGQIAPAYKYDLRRLFESEFACEVLTPEIEDLPENYSETDVRERAE